MAVELKRRRFTLAGILGEDDRVELIEGEIIEMSAIGSRHAGTVARIQYQFSSRVGNRAVVWTRNPLLLTRHQSEPRPDIIILAPRADFYTSRLPEPRDVWLVIEVADSSLFYDRGTKFPLYARAGVAESWLVNLDAGRLEIHRDRRRGRYRVVRVLGVEQSFAPAALPDLRLTLRDLLG